METRRSRAEISSLARGRAPTREASAGLTFVRSPVSVLCQAVTRWANARCCRAQEKAMNISCRHQQNLFERRRIDLQVACAQALDQFDRPPWHWARRVEQAPDIEPTDPTRSFTSKKMMATSKTYRFFREEIGNRLIARQALTTPRSKTAGLSALPARALEK